MSAIELLSYSQNSVLYIIWISITVLLNYNLPRLSIYQDFFTFQHQLSFVIQPYCIVHDQGLDK